MSRFWGVVRGRGSSYDPSQPLPPPSGSPPTVVTQQATNIMTDSATVRGSANPNGLATNVWLEHGTDPALATFASTSPIDAGAGVALLPFSAPLTGLTDDTDYFFRIAASNSAGTSKGSILTFTTSATPPDPDPDPDPGAGSVIQLVAVRDDGAAGTTLTQAMVPLPPGHWDDLATVQFWAPSSTAQGAPLVEVAAAVRTTGLPYAVDGSLKVINAQFVVPYATPTSRVPVEVRFGSPRTQSDLTWQDVSFTRDKITPWTVGYPRVMAIPTDPAFLGRCTGVFIDPLPTEAEWRALGGRYVTDLDRLLGYSEYVWDPTHNMGTHAPERPMLECHILNDDFDGLDLTNPNSDHANWRIAISWPDSGSFKSAHYDRASIWIRTWGVTGNEKWLRRGLCLAWHQMTQFWALQGSPPGSQPYQTGGTANYTSCDSGHFQHGMLTTDAAIIDGIGQIAVKADLVWGPKYGKKEEFAGEPRPIGFLLLAWLNAYEIGDTRQDWAARIDSALDLSITGSANEANDGTWRTNREGTNCIVADLTTYWNLFMHWMPVRGYKRARAAGFDHASLNARALQLANKVFPAFWEPSATPQPVFRLQFSSNHLVTFCDEANYPAANQNIDVTKMALGAVLFFHEIDPTGGWAAWGDTLFEAGVGSTGVTNIESGNGPFLRQQSGKTLNEGYWDGFSWVHAKARGLV